MRHKAGIAEAYWLGPRAGCILLHKNWERENLPTLELSAEHLSITRLDFASRDLLGRFFCVYEREDGKIVFCQETKRHAQIDFEKNPVRVAGPFNNWGQDGPWEQWELAPRETDDGGVLWEVAVDRSLLGDDLEHVPFKFVSEDWHWLKIQLAAPNHFVDEAGNTNYLFQGHRTGRHVMMFEVEGGRGIDGEYAISIIRPWHGREVLVHPGLSFYDLETDLLLGAHIEEQPHGENTVFRVFAPRARTVEVELLKSIDDPEPERHAMSLLGDELTWELRLPGNLGGQYYYLRISGDEDVISSHFDPAMRIVDPWALATASATGPGIVIDQRTLPRPRAWGRGFEPPHWHDLVIVEAHVRDLAAKAPIELTDDERLGYRGATKWIAHEDSYLRQLGANALELQPIAQFDVPSEGGYHWGYMTTNYFAPAADYAEDPARPSQITEFHDLVAECHRQGMAVIVDVVYNHVGEPPYLLFVDKAYYFHVEPDGSLTNWSGCGNTLRAESAMSKRLIIESLTHLIETYDVDGFRFDLAELVSVEVLSDIEKALKAVKSSVILIAEPWSFRGHIAWRLQSTGFAFWNDGYREFLRGFLQGKGDPGGLHYYLKGSLDHLAKFPAQSVNYVASHDDRCWIDKITENAEHDGSHPTDNDIHRSHLMIATLMSSMGIPMITAGMDFLQSKGGFNNSYLRGDLNAIDYQRAGKLANTTKFFRSWIAFRLSEWGELIRLWKAPSPEYTKLFVAVDQSAAAVLFNADLSLGNRQILFAINPHDHDVEIGVEKLNGENWLEIADRSRFDPEGVSSNRFQPEENRLQLGPIDCGMWIRTTDSGCPSSIPS